MDYGGEYVGGNCNGDSGDGGNYDGCYVLDLKCPPKTHVLAAWFPAIGKWWKLQEVGLSKK
jgi:hypothetical protein